MRRFTILHASLPPVSYPCPSFLHFFLPHLSFPPSSFPPSSFLLPSCVPALRRPHRRRHHIQGPSFLHVHYSSLFPLQRSQEHNGTRRDPALHPHLYQRSGTFASLPPCPPC